MFYLTKIENGRMNVPEPEYLTAKEGEVITDGEALVLSGGKLTACGPTAKPQFVAGKNLSGTDADRTIPVFRVTADQIYEAEVTAAPGSLSVGAKVTLAADALGVTATTASGVATIVSLNGATAANDKILVRFV